MAKPIEVASNTAALAQHKGLTHIEVSEVGEYPCPAYEPIGTYMERIVDEGDKDDAIAVYWAVYARIEGEGAWWLADFEDEDDAVAFAEGFAAACPRKPVVHYV